jgi:predicted Zn-dependent protease
MTVIAIFTNGLILIAAMTVSFFNSVSAETVPSQASLPPLQSHPLPSSLAQWQSASEVGDYFSAVEESPLGYLIWSEFPVKVYLDLGSASPSDQQRLQDWVNAVTTAIEEWDQYLPLERGDDRAEANIIIARSRPPLNTTRNPETGLMEFSRARNARTRYEFDLVGKQLIHRMNIEIIPHQSQAHTLATARHEMGHALGIWGHSPNPDDALYFSQVRQSPPISPRDVNTLKKIYQQPTRLGWKIVSPKS